MSNLSVLVLTTSFPTNDSSAGVFVWDECQDLVRNGVAVTVVAPHCAGAAKEETIDGVKVVRFRYFFPEKMQRVAYGNGIPVNLKSNFLAKLQLPVFALSFLTTALAQAKEKQIIHCHWFIAGLIGLIVKTVLRKKLVLMMHHAHTSNPIFKLILKNTDYLFCNSSFVRDATLKIFPTPNVEILPVTVSELHFKPLNHTTNSDTQRNIVAVGRLISLKGFRYLIEAVSILINDRNLSHIQLKIAGDGILMNELIQQTKDLRIDKQVTFLGQVPHNEIPTLFQEAQVFVIPSIEDENGDTEGLGLVTLEAAACGLPVVGSRVGGIPDVIEDGVNGFLVNQKNANELADRLEQLLNDEELRNKLGAAGKELLQGRFSRKSITASIINGYQKTLSN